MKAEISVFLTAMVLSFLAFATTIYYSVPLGAVELNPIGAFWIGSGLPFIGFIVGWIIVYGLFRLTVFSNRFEFLQKEHKFMLLGILLGFTFMDFLRELFSYLYIINI